MTGLTPRTHDLNGLETHRPEATPTVAPATMATSHRASGRYTSGPGRAIPTTAIIVETLVSNWMVEIDVVAAG
jgi:hypothetical protein